MANTAYRTVQALLDEIKALIPDADDRRACEDRVEKILEEVTRQKERIDDLENETEYLGAQVVALIVNIHDGMI